MTASIAPLLFALPLAGTTAGSLADPATSALLGRLALWMPLLLGMTSYGARRFDEVVLAPTRLRRWATAAAVGVAAFISLLTLSYTRTYGSNQALSTDIDYLVHDLLVSVLDFLHVTQGERLSTLTHGLIMPVCVWILPSSFLLRRSLERTATSRTLSLRTGFLFGLAVGLFVFSIARPMIDLLLMSLGGPSNYDIGVGLGLLLREGDASVLTPSRTHILLTLIGTLAAVAVGTRPLRHRPSLSETYLHLRDLGKAAPKRIPRERVSHPHRVHRQPKSVTKKVPAPDPCLGAQLAISVNNCPPPRDPRSRMTSFKRTQRKYVQKAYRVRNWQEYETGLRARGSLTVWLGLTDGKLANWNSPRPTRRKPGRQRKYSNHAIETTVTLGLVFGLASRQTEGFLRSLLTLLNLDNDVPDHSTISRRKARLGKVASYERRTVKPVHLRSDSSGLSVHVGQLRTPPKARDYRKLHLAVDEQTSDVVACELTSKRARDASRVASLVGQIERPIASAKADAAYDTGDVYKTLEHHRAHRSPKVLIPPRKGAQLALDSAGTRQRNRNIRARSRVGKRKWYVASGYSRRSKVETTFHRYKAILGSAMRARGLASQRVEVRLGCKILNTMTALGIPDGEMIG